MAGNRKPTTKAQILKAAQLSQNTEMRLPCQVVGGAASDLQLPNPLAASRAFLMPKHIALPSIPLDGELLFEVIMFLYTTMALGLQYLNLYRTVWWLPHSYNKLAMNFYLIDLHLTFFIIVLLGRRLLWFIIKRITCWLLPKSAKKSFVIQGIQYSLHLVIFAVLIWLISCLTWKHSLASMFYLIFPACIYLLLFGTNATHILELLPETMCSSNDKCASPKCRFSSMNSDKVQHVCSQNAETVRKEVDHLKLDFNCRLKQVLFNSLLSTYYSGFIPCCFAPNVLHYDTHWVTEHLVCLWLSCFTMFVVHLYPPQYCNVLHCSALHLGRWRKVEGPVAHMPHTSWSESILWHQGALVKHRKELFRAEGVSNAAEPGNTTHSRFYAFFKDPSSILCGLVGLQITLALAQITMLVFSKEWHCIIANSLLTVSNFYTLFKLIRDFLVLGKIYKTEDLLQYKMST